MSLVQGAAEILNDLRGLEGNFDHDSWQIPKKISDSWQFMIHVVDAIESGDYLQAIDYHPGASESGMMMWIVDTSDNQAVNYPGFVEGGTKNMAARFPGQKAVEREDFVQSITRMVERGFSHAQRK